MKKEDFVAMGISDELAEKLAKKSEEELKGYVPRSRLNEEATARKNAETSYNDIKAELDKLKETAGDNEALQEKIKTLQEELKTKDSTYAAEISEMKMSNAIAAALGASVKDAGIVSRLLDKSKLVLTEDGKVVGLDEQITNIRKSKPFLFEEGEAYPEVHDGGEPGGKPGGKATRDLFADALNGVI